MLKKFKTIILFAVSLTFISCSNNSKTYSKNLNNNNQSTISTNSINIDNYLEEIELDDVNEIIRIRSMELKTSKNQEIRTIETMFDFEDKKIKIEIL